MNQNRLPVLFWGLALLLLSACNLPAATPAAATSSPPPTQPAAPTPLPAVTETASPTYAPFCKPDATLSLPEQCGEIRAEQTSSFCVKKNPYQVILLKPGSQYAALTWGFTCADGGVRNGNQIITCAGNMNTAYQVQVCDPACAVPTVTADVTQCMDGYRFDYQLGCCTDAFLQLQPNCRVFTFEMSSCLVDCNEFKKKATCNEHSVACIWDVEKKYCKAR